MPKTFKPKSPLYPQIADKVDGLIAHYKAQAFRFGGFAGTPAAATPVNWVEILTKFVATVVTIIQQITTGSAADKRQAVVDAVDQFYLTVLEPIVAGAINHPLIFNNFIEPFIEKELPLIVGGLYDALQAVLTRPAPPPLPPAPAPSGGGTGLPEGFQPY